MSRTSKAIKNISYGIGAKLVLVLMQFLNRTVFIYFLSIQYLGVNGLYTELLSLLSFVELGFGAAMNFALYKPASQNDTAKLIQLLDFYKVIYRIIAAVIAVIGLILVPFLPYIIKNADTISVNELRIYFIFFLFNTVIEYFVSYKYSYLNALQKNFITTRTTTITTCICMVAQFVVIIVFKDYLAYLIANSITLAISRFVIAYYLNKKFTVLAKKPDEKLSKADRKGIFHEVKGLIVHQFSSVAVHSTDSIVISTLTQAGVTAVGLISNYNLILNGFLSFIRTIFENIASGFGNIAAENKTEEFHNAFTVYNFISFWIFGFAVCSFYVLIPDFITLWIGEDKLIDDLTFTLILINFYLEGMSTSYNYARIAKGNFNIDKMWALAQAIVNLIVSVVGAIFLGLPGVFLGSVISRLIYVIFRPKVTFKMLFNRSPWKYYLRYIYGIIKAVIAIAVMLLIKNLLFTNIDIWEFCIMILLDIIVVNIVFLVMSFFTKEFKQTLNFIRHLIANHNNQA